MTKEEFDRLGITERDLVCVHILSEGKAIGKVLACFFKEMKIGDTDFFALYADDNCKMTREIEDWEVESIEIIKKDFWK